MLAQNLRRGAALGLGGQDILLAELSDGVGAHIADLGGHGA